MIKEKHENRIPNLSAVKLNNPQEENIFCIIIKHRWIILYSIIFFLSAAFLYILKSTPIYISSSKVYIESTTPRIINDYDSIMSQSNNYLSTQAMFMKSTPIIADVVEKGEFKNLKTFSKIDNLTDYIKKTVDVSIGKKDDIITVSYSSPYPHEAAQIVNALVGSYIEYYSGKKQSTVSKVLDILQKEKYKRDQELSNKFKEILQFTKTNGIVSYDDHGGHIIFQKLTKLSEALTEAQLEGISAKADLEAVESMTQEPEKIRYFASMTPAPNTKVFIANDIEAKLLSELTDTEIDLRSAESYVTKCHPAMKALDAKVNYIRDKINKETRNFADSYTEITKLKWATTKQKEGKLQESFDALKKDAQEVGVKAVEYTILNSELQRAERICEILDNRIKELNVTEDTGALNIGILEYARVEPKPAKPEKSKVMGMALILGILFGGTLALLREWLDYRFKTVEEISATLELPILGTIPKILPEQTITDQSYELWKNIKATAIDTYHRIYDTSFSRLIKNQTYASHILLSQQKQELTVLDTQGIVERGQKVILKPKSSMAEAYRTLRTALFLGIFKKQTNTIMITSPSPKEGKSMIVANLGLTIAQTGQKTLIIDADLRRPMQHIIFETENKIGLSNVIVGTATLEESIQPGPIDGINILQCGMETPNPAELLSSTVFEQILNTLSEKYDCIIIDSPPVELFADSQIIAALCDISLLVIRMEQSTKKLSIQARNRLMSTGGRLFGAIVNDIPRTSSRYGYYSGHGYYDHYGDYENNSNSRESSQSVKDMVKVVSGNGTARQVKPETVSAASVKT